MVDLSHHSDVHEHVQKLSVGRIPRICQWVSMKNPRTSGSQRLRRGISDLNWSGPLFPKRIGISLPICHIYPEARQYLTQHGCRKPFEPRRHDMWRKPKNVAGIGFHVYSCACPRRDIFSELAMQLKRAQESRYFLPMGHSRNFSRPAQAVNSTSTSL